MTTTELGPLPEHFAQVIVYTGKYASGGYCAEVQTASLRSVQERLYTADQMRAYAQQHIAALKQEIARQKEVIASVNARCDHLGMSLRDIKADRDSWAQQASDRTQDAVDLVAAERERHADALRCALDALDHCCDDTTGRHRAVAQRLREMLNG